MYCFQDYKKLYSDIMLPATSVSLAQWNGLELFQTGMQMGDEKLSHSFPNS